MKKYLLSFCFCLQYNNFLPFSMKKIILLLIEGKFDTFIEYADRELEGLYEKIIF